MSNRPDDPEELEETKRFPPDPGEEEESSTLDGHIEGDPLEAEEDAEEQTKLGDDEESTAADVDFPATERHEE